jgi:hypothetical protein
MRAIYATTIFLGSLLLFLMQPIAAKELLPQYGGSAGVWTMCMLFFQTVLLLGYLYAHALARIPGPRTAASIHLGLLLVTGIWLLSAVKPQQAMPTHPTFGILASLFVSVGLPFFTLSTTSPLLQHWYAASFHSRFPYWLYSVSNAASLVGLFSFPYLLEPLLDLNGFRIVLIVVMWVYLLTTGFAVVAVKKSQEVPLAPMRPKLQQLVFWMALAATGSALWMAIANHISQNLAAIPLLWVWPLGLYLLSFVLVFASDRWYSPQVFRWLMPLAGLGLALSFPLQASGETVLWSIALLLLALFIGCLFLHGELARRKPDARMLTTYYLAISGGGAIGGLFVAVISPAIFNHYLELPTCVVATFVLAVILIYGLNTQKNKAHLGFLALAVVLILTQLPMTFSGERLRERNFYGVVTVADDGRGKEAKRTLYHGSIQHGLQFLEPDRRLIPTAYYGMQSGAGLLLQAMTGGPRHVALIGMGIGTLAVYGRSGDLFRFYEINPLVAKVAREQFYYTRDSAANVEVEVSDGRIGLLQEAPGERFDAIIVDAFSGDAIPTHLITREALQLYFRKLKPGGAVAFHITNKYLDLYPVLERIAAAMNQHAILLESPRNDADQVYAARWTVITSNQTLLDKLRPAAITPPVASGRVWTDGYTNLLEAIRR